MTWNFVQLIPSLLYLSYTILLHYDYQDHLTKRETRRESNCMIRSKEKAYPLYVVHTDPPSDWHVDRPCIRWHIAGRVYHQILLKSLAVLLKHGHYQNVLVSNGWISIVPNEWLRLNLVWQSIWLLDPVLGLVLLSKSFLTPLFHSSLTQLPYLSHWWLDVLWRD